MTTFRRIALSTALLITSSIHLAGFAQPANSPQGVRPMMGGAQMEAHREARHQKHLNDLKSALQLDSCLLYTSPSPRDRSVSRMPSSA